MTVLRKGMLFAAAAALAGCMGGLRGETGGKDISEEVAQSVRRASESHTLSRLAALERSLNDYIQAKGNIPPKLNVLVPDYIAEIPEAELGLPRDHIDKNVISYYPAGIISDGQINGALIKDTGGWGYVFNDRQVIVFIDCVHKRMDGSPWYQARGVF